MILEDGFDLGVEVYFAHRIAEQVADHPHFSSVGEFDDDDQVWARGLERRMRWMPDALPAINSPAARHAMPAYVQRVAFVTYPLGRELKCRARMAALRQRLAAP